MSNSEAANLFREAIRTRRGVDPGEIVLDGKVKRFATKPNGRDEAGWCIGFGDGIPAGSFGDWRSGIVETWCARDLGALTTAEREAHRRIMAEVTREREEERQRMHREAAAKAGRIWAEAEPAEEHPYLQRKAVGAHGVKMSRGAVVVPVRIDGRLTSLQFIDADGGKRFLSGGEIRGGYHAIGKPEAAVIVCEGYATGATLHALTGHGVAVAFNAGNLLAAARAIRAKLPGARIIVAADDDWCTDGNPGLTKAREAAAAVGGSVAVPPFDRAAGEQGTDWNDWAQSHGREKSR